MKEKVDLPRTLLEDRSISPLAKFVYLVALSVEPKSLIDLAFWTALSPSRVSRLCDELENRGWIAKERRGRNTVPVPGIPQITQDRMTKELHMGLRVTSHKGEFLMKKWLDCLISDDEYVDNARPSFLQSPDTGEPLEYDRYYPACEVAFEFQGMQHFKPTNAYPDQEQFRQGRKRDLLKLGLSSECGVTLITVTAEDLNLQRMLEKIPPTLPRAVTDPNGPYVRELERVSSEYRAGLSRREIKEQRLKTAKT